MEFKSVFGEPSGGGSGRAPATTKAEMAYNTIKGHTDKNGNKTLVSVFYIGTDILKAARFLVGDYVDVMVSDCGKYGLIKRTTSGGRKVGMNGKARNCGKVSFKKTDIMPFVSASKKVQSVSIDGEGILFEWPESDKENL